MSSQRCDELEPTGVQFEDVDLSTEVRHKGVLVGGVICAGLVKENLLSKGLLASLMDTVLFKL